MSIKPDTAKQLSESDEAKSHEPSMSMPYLLKGGTLEHKTIFADRYRVLEQVGSGGMGTVYKVKHIHLDNLLALKVLNRQSVTVEAFRRFEQEARFVSRMKHPNIVTVHDFEISDGQPYLVMDYLEGSSLASILRSEGFFDLQRFQRLILQSCSALAHAHESGVIHRDLKPGNIIVTSSSEGQEQAVLVDFGIAKVLPLADESRDTLTQTGAVLGSPQYMSPEQYQSNNVCAQSDIYSLGCVMYEMLVGQPPFQSDNVFSIVFRHLNDAPPPFPERLRRTLQGRQIEAIVLKALAKSPDERYQSAIELASDLKQAERLPVGLWSNIKTSFKMANARKNSAHKTAWLQRRGLALLSWLAICIAATLFLLPGQISDAAAKIELNGQLIERTDQLVRSSWQKSTNAMIHTGTISLKRLDEIAERFNDEPEKLALIRNAVATSVSTIKTTRALYQSLVGTLSQFLRTGTNPEFDLEGPFLSSTRVWGDNAIACSALKSVAYQDLTQQQHRLQFCSALFLVLWFTGVVVDAMLLSVLLRRSLIKRITRKFS